MSRVSRGEDELQAHEIRKPNEDDPIFVALSRHPFVDGHCHNIVEDAFTPSYDRAFSEAEGQALEDAQHTLSFKRSIREIAGLLQCEGNVQSIKERRQTLGEQSVARKCFGAASISALLIDDGLRAKGARSLKWHKAHVPLVRRVLRVERIAEDILSEVLPENKALWTLDSFKAKLHAALDPLPESVVAFKSIAAYRSGLDIDPNVKREDAEEALANLLARGQYPVRIVDKQLVDFIFVMALEVATKLDIPVQIHTGFGDKDLDLRLANPANLRRVLEDKRFEKSKIVLLHASYPYMREAGYLASVYPQVYLDFGLAIPKLSIHGMTSVLMELLELAPLNKVMASTDGYFFPETFYLGALWSRRILSRVLSCSVQDGDLTESEAIAAGKAILNGNAAQLYSLGNAGSQNCWQNCDEVTVNNPECPAKAMCGPVVILNQNEHVRVIIMDTSGIRRSKAIPKPRYEKVTRTEGVSLAKAVMALPTPYDALPTGCGYGPDKEVRLIPAEDTRRTIPWFPDHDIVLSTCYITPGRVWETCPRGNLIRMLAQLKEEFGLELYAGFEHEFYLLQPVTGPTTGKKKWAPITEMGNYAASVPFDFAAPLLSRISEFLGRMGIALDMVHSESGPGQFEIVQRYSEALSAADNVVYVREAVTAVAQKEGIRASFIPKYFEDACGSGNHMHMSISDSEGNVFGGSAEDPGTKWGISTRGQQFMAGILQHLPAILAVTTPSPNSYERLIPSHWSGAFLCWGLENREAPLRVAVPPSNGPTIASNVELKAIDGTSNPYIALAAVIAAGMDGLRQGLLIPEPVEGDPALFPGKYKRLPTTLDEAVAELEKDTVVKSGLGDALSTVVLASRKFECDYCKKIGSAAFKEMLVIRH